MYLHGRFNVMKIAEIGRIGRALQVSWYFKLGILLKKTDVK